MGPRPARRRARPSEDQGRLPRLRADRRAAEVPLPRQRRGRPRPGRTRISPGCTTPSSTPSARRPTVGWGSRARICPAPGRRPSSSPGTTAIPTTRTSTSTFPASGRSWSAPGTSPSTSSGCSRSPRRRSSCTDTTDAAIEAILGSGLKEIVMVARRGPAQAAFTTPELKELGELADADVAVDAGRPRARPGQRGGARARHERAAERRGAPRVRVARAGRQEADDPAALRRLAGGDPRRGARRGGRDRPERAGRRRVGAHPRGGDGGARDDSVLDRLPQRRLPRGRPAGDAVRRAAGDDPEPGGARARRARRSARRVSTARAGSSAARAA